MSAPTVLEICAGGGGEFLGLEQAGFEHVAVLDNDPDACNTLRLNRPELKVFEADLRDFDATWFRGVDLVAGGVPCTPFSVGGLQLGEDDERHLLPHALRVVGETWPRAVLLENVPGLAQAKFERFRMEVLVAFWKMGYEARWGMIQCSDYGLPQLRPRYILIAMRDPWRLRWKAPLPLGGEPLTVGEAIGDLMAAGGWEGAREWEERASAIAPTIVGGSKKHGGGDLGPTRAKRYWRERFGVNAISLADEPPGPGHQGLVKLTIPMVARLQGFPDDWAFSGLKTARYRQVGNAFPPPAARAFGRAIRTALTA
jgi:DNA (cytosine-5)-methyltransferase 1